MNKPTFEDFLVLCQLNIEKRYTEEILNITIDSDCIYLPGIIMPYQHLLDIYTIRLEMAEESKTLSENVLADFRNCVTNFKMFSADSIGIASLSTQNNSYMVFYIPEENLIIGTIKFSENDSIIHVENYNSETIRAGYQTKAQKFSKRKLIHDWCEI